MGAFHKPEQESLRDAALRLRAQRADTHWQWLCDQLVIAAERDVQAQVPSASAERVLAAHGIDTSGGSSAGLVHHFGNVLMGILGAGRLAARTLEATDPARPYVDEIVAQAERGVALGNEVLCSARASAGIGGEDPCSCAADTRAADATERLSTPPSTSPSILLVEDERLIRITLRHELQALGYVVDCASDGNEAVRMIEARSEPLDLLLTDVVVPGPTGPEIAKLARTKWPSLQVVFMSAYPRDVLIQQGRIQVGQVTLEKPFTEEQLLGTLREALRQH